MPWLAAHWLDIMQTTGIVGSLFFAGWSAHHEGQARRSAALFKLTEQHRELWREMLTRDDLHRVLSPAADPVETPLSKEETVFVTLLFLHLNTAHNAIRAKILREPEGLTLDIRTFFSLPVPAAGWKQMRHLHDARFVAFVEARISR